MTLHFRRWLASCALAGILLLPACGPGVGGTGTGNGLDAGAIGLERFGAAPASVCVESFAPLLGCETVIGSDQPVLTDEHVFAGPCAVAAFRGDVVDLDILCEGLHFSGRWGIDGAGRSRYFGLAGTDPQLSMSEPATLEVVADGETLQLTLRAADSEILVGPLPVRPSGR